jgi:hypothetical protein
MSSIAHSPMKFLETSPDIPTDLIREVNDGGVVFLCGAGVSKDAGLPLFQQLTDDVYVRLGESKDNEAAERIAYERAEYDRVLRSLEKRTLLPGMDSRVRSAVNDLLAVPKGADLSRHLSILQLSRDKMGRPRLLRPTSTPYSSAPQSKARGWRQVTPADPCQGRVGLVTMEFCTFMAASQIHILVSRKRTSS